MSFAFSPKPRRIMSLFWQAAALPKSAWAWIASRVFGPRREARDDASSRRQRKQRQKEIRRRLRGLS